MQTYKHHSLDIVKETLKKTQKDRFLGRLLNSILSTQKKVKAIVEKLKQIDGYIIVDCPGNLNDNNLSILFEAADFIVVPMAYDVDTIDATGIFVNVVKKRSQAKLLFLPNRINVSEGRAKDLEMRDRTIQELNKVGKVLPRIKQSVIIKRYTTIYPLDMYQYMALEEPFEAIIKEIKKKRK